MIIAQTMSNSWSELLTSSCLLHNACESRDDMELIWILSLHPLLVRVSSLHAFIAASLRKMLRMEAHDSDFASQRVCPFSGLITPRYETCCLECGKALKAA